MPAAGIAPTAPIAVAPIVSRRPPVQAQPRPSPRPQALQPVPTSTCTRSWSRTSRAGRRGHQAARIRDRPEGAAGELRHRFGDDRGAQRKPGAQLRQACRNTVLRVPGHRRRVRLFRGRTPRRRARAGVRRRVRAGRRAGCRNTRRIAGNATVADPADALGARLRAVLGEEAASCDTATPLAQWPFDTINVERVLHALARDYGMCPLRSLRVRDGRRLGGRAGACGPTGAPPWHRSRLRPRCLQRCPRARCSRRPRGLRPQGGRFAGAGHGPVHPRGHRDHRPERR